VSSCKGTQPATTASAWISQGRTPCFRRLQLRRCSVTLMRKHMHRCMILPRVSLPARVCVVCRHQLLMDSMVGASGGSHLPFAPPWHDTASMRRLQAGGRSTTFA